MAFTIKKNDLEPKLRATLRNADGTPIDLTSATVVNFSMKSSTPAVTKEFKAAGTFIDKAGGVVEYPWATGNTDTVATYRCEFEVLFGTRPMTVPNADFYIVTIVDDLG